MASTPTGASRPYDVYIVSDLHLSNGYNSYRGRYDPREDFFYDAEFANLLRHLSAEGLRRDRPVRLVLLGDVFEMLQVDGMPDPDEPAYQDEEVQRALQRGEPFHGLSTSALATRWRLEQIAAGHATWFAALAGLLSSDPRARIDLVVGNHDIELSWPEAQERFRELVAAHSSDPQLRDPASLRERIRCHAWFVYEPGFFYAEHGHQYDDLNSFATLLRPVLPGNEQLIELPLGSFFVRYIFNRIERFDYFADNIRPVTRYLTWALVHHPVRGLLTLFYHMRFFTRMLRKTTPLTAEQQRERRQRYWREVLGPYAERMAAEQGLSLEQLMALDQLAVLPSTRSRWAQFVKLVLDPLLPALIWLGPVTALFQLLRRAQRSVRYLLTAMAGLLVLISRERETLTSAVEQPNNLLETARRIDAILRRNGGPGALFYVFGHTHQAELFPLGKQNLPRYLNSGTWTPILDPQSQLLRDVVQLNVVRLLREDDGSALGELLMWDDAAGRLSRVLLV